MFHIYIKHYIYKIKISIFDVKNLNEILGKKCKKQNREKEGIRKDELVISWKYSQTGCSYIYIQE